MTTSLLDLIRSRNFDEVSRIVESRWGITPTPEALRWLHRIAIERPSMAMGGTAEGPWGESTWLLWVKNRLDDFSSKPRVDEDPAEPYGTRFDVESKPGDAIAWRVFLGRFSRELIAWEARGPPGPLPPEVREAGWMGYPPAEESTIRAAESRLGRRLPPSLRGFYSVSNGWRATGPIIHDILPVESIGWLAEREPNLHRMASLVGSTEGPFLDDPGGSRLAHHRDEQGTRVERSLVLNSEGDDATWLLDPGPAPHPGEWPAGSWAHWHPAMAWTAANFAELMAAELRSLVDLRDD